jgi:hypothetical protein
MSINQTTRPWRRRLRDVALYSLAIVSHFVLGVHCREIIPASPHNRRCRERPVGWR